MSKKILIYLLIGIFFVSFVSALIVESLDNVYVESNDPKIGGETWVGSLVSGIGSQELVGGVKINKESIEDADGAIAEHDLYIREKDMEQECAYEFRDTGDYSSDIYSIDTVPGINGEIFYFWEGQDKYIDECRNSGGDYYVVKALWGGTKGQIHCFEKKKKGDYGTLAFDTLNFDLEIELEADGKKRSGVINNYNTPAKTIGYGDTQAYLRWKGSLTSGERCPDVPNDIYAGYSGGNWRTIKGDRYDKYTNYEDGGFIDCLDDYLNDYKTVSECMNTFNNKANSALYDANWEDSKSGDEATINLEDPIQYPSLQLRIKTDWLGIKIPVGDPSIENIINNPTNFLTDENPEVKINIRNKAEHKSEFTTSINCENNIETLGTVSNINIGGYDTETATVRLQNTKKDVKESFCETCIVEVKATEQTSNSDSDSFEACVEPRRECENGETKCEGVQYYVCENGFWERDKSNDDKCEIACNSDSDCSSDRPFCINGECYECESDSDCSGGKICKDNFCKSREDLCPGWWEEQVTSKDTGFFGWREWIPFIEPKETIECKTKDWVIWTGLGIIILILGVTAIIVYAPKKNNSKLKNMKGGNINY
ncbi:MAG: hypothetical protein ACOCV1_01680 [Bacillota bacterium]